MASDLKPDTHEDRRRQARRLADECLLKRAAGMSLPDAELIARHPEWMPELAEELQRARLIAHARDHANAKIVAGLCEAGSLANAGVTDPSYSFETSASEAHSVSLQCPHCRAAIPISTGASWAEIVCPACGSGFKLLGDEENENSLQPGAVIGRFELIERIGTGGFGVVWKARDPQLDRVVALKIPRRGELTGAEAEAFFREARAAAQVRHPGIVSIHEVGRDDGVIYLVSDFVDGEPLTVLLEDKRPTIRDAAKLCHQTAVALAHIHERGIVHRDLKPANIIVTTSESGELQSHLTDFGLARRMAGEVTMTVDGQLMGTPAYMSPEQASGGGHAAGPAADIYSLGVILFELLTGEPPFRGAPTMILDQVLHEEPVNPRRLNAHVPRDLETITIKCLEKDPARRYATAAALADDLDRWLRGEPIVARPLSRFAQVNRWRRRHPVVAAATIALVIGGPAIGLILAGFAWREATARQAAESAYQQTRQVLYASTMKNVQSAVEQGDLLRAEQLLNRQRPAAGEDDLRSFEWYYWWRQSHSGLVASVPHPPNHLVDSAEITNLRRVAAPFLPEHVDSEDSLKPNILSLNQPMRRPSLINKLFDNKPVHGGQVSDAAFSADGRLLATCGRDGTVQLWDAKTHAHRATLYAEPHCSFECVDISPKGRFVAASLTLLLPDKTPVICEVYVWNVGDGQVYRRTDLFKMQCEDLAFSPDEQELTVVGDAAPIVINIETRTQRMLESPGLEGTDCVYSPDGRHMAGFLLGKNVVWLWDLATGEIRRTFSPHREVSAVRFYPTAQHLVSVGRESLKLWSISEDTAAPTLTEPEPLGRLAFTEDGRRIVTETMHRRMGSIWDLSTGQRIREIGPDLRNMSLARDANVIAASIENDVVLCSAISGERIRTLQAHTRPVHACHIAKSGAFIATGDAHPDNQLLLTDAMLWNAESGQLLHRLPGHVRCVQAVAVAPDDRTLVTVDGVHILRIWDVSTGKLMLSSDALVPEWAAWGVNRVIFSGDCQTLYACSGGTVQVVDPVTGTLRRELADGTTLIWDLCLSPDGKTLALAREADHVHDEGIVELWDLASGELKTTLAEEHGSAICVAFSPDGHTLASGHRNGTIAFWQAASDEEVLRQASNE